MTRLVLLPEDGSWVVVPKDPTDEMYVPGLRVYDDDENINFLKLYSAVLAARPPVEGVEVTEEMIKAVIKAEREAFPRWKPGLPGGRFDDLDDEIARAILALLTGKQKGGG